MDLYRDDIHVIIQWETAPAVSGKTTTTKTGISLACLKDITLFKTTGKMLIGWALNDTITQTAGSIKFSVRFYKFNGAQELDYSLSTLTAQATINPGLNYTWEGGTFVEDIYDDSVMLSNRIKDSVQPGEAGSADTPEFLEGFHLDKAFTITMKEIDTETGETKDVVYNAIDLIATVDGDNSVLQRDFVVQASGDGIISYTWSRKDLQTGNEIQLEDKTGIVGTEHIPTVDTKFSGDKLYYTQDDPIDGIVSYSIYTVAPGEVGKDIPEELLPDPNEPDKEGILYERVSHCEVTYPNKDGKGGNVTGIYTIRAKNKVGLASALAYEKVYIPGPDSASFAIEMPEGQSEQVYLSDGVEGAGTTTLRILGKTDRVTSEDGTMPGDTIVYQWGDQPAEEVINIANATPNEFTIADVPAEERMSYDKTIKVEVYATRNGEVSPTLSQSYRITDAAHAPEVTIGRLTDGSKNIRLGSTKETVQLVAKVDNYDAIRHTGDGDSVSYEWYKVVKDINEDGTTAKFNPTNDSILVDTDGCIVVDAVEGLCKFVFNPDNHIKLADGSFAVDGLYYCKVINKVNGSVAFNDIDALTLDDCISITIAD